MFLRKLVFSRGLYLAVFPVPGIRRVFCSTLFRYAPPRWAIFKTWLGGSDVEAIGATGGFGASETGARVPSFDAATVASSQICSARAVSRSSGKPAGGSVSLQRSFL